MIDEFPPFKQREKELARIRSILLECCALNNIDASSFYSCAHGIIARNLKAQGCPKEDVVGFLKATADYTLSQWEEL